MAWATCPEGVPAIGGKWHPEGVVDSLIKKFRHGVSGELSNRLQVIDALLDLRLEAAGQDAVVDEVDRLLHDLPGMSIVPNAWWLAALDDLEKVVRRSSSPLAANEARGEMSAASVWEALTNTEWNTTPLPRRRRPDQ